MNADGTGELTFEGQKLTNRAPDMTADEMAVGADDFGELAQPLATGVTMVAYTVDLAGSSADLTQVHGHLRHLGPAELGGLMARQRRHEQWDLPEGEVREWARSKGLL